MWSMDLQKTAAKYEKLDHHGIFADVDRYVSDRLECYISMRGSITGYDVAFQVNASQLGIASYVQYWHYQNNEFELAKKTFEAAKEVNKKIIADVEYNKIPFACIGPMTRAALKNIDVEHKEKSGVVQFNTSLRYDNDAADWRETIYGNRYPGHDIANQTGKVINTKETSKQIETSGKGRFKSYKLK